MLFPQVICPHKILLLPSVNSLVTASSDVYFKWHYRLGHPSLDTLNNVLKSWNMSSFQKNKNEFCVAYCLEKSHRLPSSLSNTMYNEPLELVFCDLWGPSPM